MMTTPNAPLQPPETDVDDDVELLSETLEEVLAYSGDKSDQKYVELKTRVQQTLDDVKTRMSQAYDTYYLKARQAVSAADDYVQENPWHGVGIGASVGLIVGLLMALRYGCRKE